MSKLYEFQLFDDSFRDEFRWDGKTLPMFRYFQKVPYVGAVIQILDSDGRRVGNVITCECDIYLMRLYVSQDLNRMSGRSRSYFPPRSWFINRGIIY